MGNGSIEDEDTPAANIIDTHSIEFMGVFSRIYICDTKEEIVLAFRGTEPNPEDNPRRFVLNWMTNTIQSLGLPSLAYEFAADLVNVLTQEFPNHSILCTGISLGGGLAHYAAAMNGLRAYCFNSPHLADETLTQIIDTILEHPNPEAFIKNIESNIHHIHVRGDILQDIISLIPGEKLGNQCAIPPHEGLAQKSSNLLKKLKNKIERHFTEHLVPSLQLFIDKETA